MHISLILQDIRSCHNVGSLLRTAEGIGVKHVYLTGYTPYPIAPDDERLPHIREKLARQIHKTALGAEETQSWSHHDNVETVFASLKASQTQLVALEQNSNSVPLPEFKTNNDVAVLLGREVEGIDARLLSVCDTVLEIPMVGQKESFNVVQAAAMTLYHLRFVANS
jgi:tRNA G18 (ribose-2'-O)-methylase SpoU